ncbi:ABC transporter ATP-binding protein/permease [Clostridium estertheticum]|uniref:ABC transporter ATP-binding protein n=1 Tax=Clostridium estertheticum TaxID=238834 RepID=UPI001C7CA4A5|nr:ABC transporter ATP-binding protein [Clostridium estertheticum]MBX4261748.1 ABC transporter ATP-binding protein/permease [Clostridium estertheticum]WLC70114.1 ABC transporter ATP-binding protein/permease [Clostridium estertheticum]
MNILKIWKLSDKKALFILQLLMNIGMAGITIIVSNFAKNAVDHGIEEGKMLGIFVQFVIITFFGVGLSYSGVIIRSKFSIGLIEKLRNITNDKLINSKYEYFENESSGSINNRILHDMSSVADYMSGGLPEFLSNMIVFICCFIYLLTLNITMTLVSALCIPVAVAVAKRVAAPTYDTMEKFGKKMDEVMGIAQDTVNGIKIEKAYNLRGRRKKYFDESMEQATSYFVAYEKLVVKAGPYKYVIRSAPMFVSIMLGFYNAYKGNITNGEMLAFILLLQNVSKPLSELTRYVTEFKEAMVSVDRVMEIVELSEEAFGTGEAFEREIAFELQNVSFSYGKDNKTSDNVLNDISLVIPKGKTVALVGSSGSGKSTLFKLLLGFHTTTQGEVRLFGKNIMEWDIEKARKNISYVAQDTYLFEGTVAQNIAYGKPDASFNEIIQAAEKAYAHDFIMSMPEGYQTVLSERGTNISGGQKQRIAIARAFLKDAPIFLLDEMTSALDVESEKLIQKAIENYSERKTVILIAHRLSTIINADEIYVLSHGIIAENGTHEGLLEKKGVYTMLYSNQVLGNTGEQDA